jgi:uncharacterized glyoxalase superfamily protein PhnB
MENKIPTMGRAVPVFTVADLSTTIDWYQNLFGFWSDPFPDHEPYVFAMLFRDDVEIMLQRLEGYEKPDIYKLRNGGVWDAYIRVESVKELYEAVRDQVTVVQPLRQQPYGCWEFEVKDPNGYVLVFSEPGE